MSQEIEIQKMVDFNIFFNRKLGINCDNTDSPNVCKNLLLSLKNSEENNFQPMFEDLDGLEDYDLIDEEEFFQDTFVSSGDKNLCNGS